ncbi:hypothetical protein HZA87_04270 [Candidatus Uhrbacteria bacterium]|nr:hypothetical protein [Candidatus Uhrbacteria bacterium]
MAARFFPLVLFVLLVLSVGCGQTTAITQTAEDTTQPAQPQGTTYQNARFGYQFTVPDGTLVYALNLEDQTARLAGADDEIVFVAGEGTNVLTIRGVEGDESLHEWLTDHVAFFYPKGEAAQRIERIDGKQTIALYGAGTSGSPARLLVTQNDDRLIVITFEQEAELFDGILSTLTFNL